MKRIYCFGGAHLDRTARCKSTFTPGASNPVTVAGSPGGAALNTAFNLKRLGVEVALVSVLGADASGDAIRRAASDLGLDMAGLVRCAGRASASYTAILDPSGELVAGLADMEIYEQAGAAALERGLARLKEQPETGDCAFLDANLPAQVLSELGASLGARGLRLTAAAVSPAKVLRLTALLEQLELLFCNRLELAVLTGCEADDDAALRAAATELSARYGLGLVVTRGAEGVTLFEAGQASDWPALTARPVDVNGAGDAFAAGTLTGLRMGMAPGRAILLGRAAASLTVEVTGSSDPELSLARVQARAESR